MPSSDEIVAVYCLNDLVETSENTHYDWYSSSPPELVLVVRRFGDFYVLWENYVSITGRLSHEPLYDELRSLLAGLVRRPDQYLIASPVKSAECSAEILHKSLKATTVAADLLDNAYLSQLCSDADTSGTISRELRSYAELEEIQKAIQVCRIRRVRQENLQKARDAKDAPIRQAVREVYRDCRYRGASYKHKVGIELVKSRDSVGVKATTGSAWKGKWIRTTSRHEIRVHRSWTKLPLQFWKNQLVLDMKPAGQDTRKRPLYWLTFVKQGRGTHLETHKVRVVQDDETFRLAPVNQKAEARKAARSKMLRELKLSESTTNHALGCFAELAGFRAEADCLLPVCAS